MLFRSAALRFFAERRIKTHFVDLNERAASLGELRRFAQKFGVQALIDRDAKRFTELGLKAALLSGTAGSRSSPSSPCSSGCRWSASSSS